MSYIVPNGLQATNLGKSTYCASSSAFTPPATPTDLFTITGSATKVVRILKMIISSTQGTAGVNAINLVKRSTANTAGTHAAPTAVPNDSTNAAATATVLQYTANPTTGTLVGQVWSGWLGSPVVTTTGLNGLQGIELDFVDMFGQPITLHGANEVLAWNFGGAALPAGLSILANVQWTEE